MYWLILSVVMVTGEYQSLAVKYKTHSECEANMPKAREMVAKHKGAITGFVAVCAKVEDNGESS
jgi:hypothetical protein